MSVNLWLIAFLTANNWYSLSCSWCKPLFVHKQYAAGSPPSTWNLEDLSVCFFCLPTIASMAASLFGFPSGSEVQVGTDQTAAAAMNISHCMNTPGAVKY